MSSDFIRQVIHSDLSKGLKKEQVATRFPPEPNGYLHIGHAKSICLNFGIAQEYGGTCNLRFDDTNPSHEDVEYVESIQEDVRWLGFQWSQLYYASDYFEKLYEFAVQLIHLKKAYVCSLNADQIREYRGTLQEPGRESPDRNRSVEENLSLFEKMRKGEFSEGTYVLRARIDMQSPNVNMRDPVIYRIRHVPHDRTQDHWCLYPMYDYAHCISDMLEGITHSICTLEFEDHRPLYDWFLDTLKTPCHPQQIEFARLNLDYTVMSKRKLLQLVEDKHVSGWDDPRIPTLQGLRRRGIPPEAIRSFCEKIGVTKKESSIEFGFLENCVREVLDPQVPRRLGVLRPLKIVLENYSEGTFEELPIPNHPSYPEFGTRQIRFSRELYIEQEDFMENPPKQFFRLAPGREVRLRSAYVIRCQDVKKDPNTGEIIELRCTYDPTTRGGNTPDGRKIQGTLHWVSAAHSIPAEIRLYDRLFQVQFPGTQGQDFLTQLNPRSIEVLKQSRVEMLLGEAVPEFRFQLERLGYFCVDRWDSQSSHLVLNRTVTLKDSWQRMQQTAKSTPGTLFHS